MDKFYIIFAALAAILTAIIYKFCGIDKVKEWLLYAVCTAEAELGSGTGKLKLATVYNMFIEKFPKFSKILPFSIFSRLVDKSLDVMREWLQNNKAIAAAVKKEK